MLHSKRRGQVGWHGAHGITNGVKLLSIVRCCTPKLVNLFLDKFLSVIFPKSWIRQSLLSENSEPLLSAEAHHAAGDQFRDITNAHHGDLCVRPWVMPWRAESEAVGIRSFRYKQKYIIQIICIYILSLIIYVYSISRINICGYYRLPLTAGLHASFSIAHPPSN